MLADSDVLLIGTGLAPLIAATELMSQGKNVLVLNPDPDFFLEDSELPLNPLPSIAHPESIVALLAADEPAAAYEDLKPCFPGAVELAGKLEKTTSRSFHDPLAPHVRKRSRLLIGDRSGLLKHWGPEEIERIYEATSEARMNPILLEGISAEHRFPGMGKKLAIAGPTYESRGILLPRSFDVDVTRYRNGVLEFVREKLGPQRLICGASQIELMPGGARFHSHGAPMARTTRVSERVLVFWTPRMSSLVGALFREAQAKSPAERTMRLWEQWSIISREELDSRSIGTFREMTVWAEAEGATPAPDRLAVLRPVLGGDRGWADAGSFDSLGELCHDFLGWDRFRVRSMRPRLIFENPPGSPEVWRIPRPADGFPSTEIHGRCDGALVEVVRAARKAVAA